MPMIEVDEKTLKFLQECQEALKTQDNRMTANVIFFNEYPERDYSEYGDGYHSDGNVWYDPDASEAYDSDKEFLEFAQYNLPELFSILKKYHELANTDLDVITWLTQRMEDSYGHDLYDVLSDVIQEVVSDEDAEDDLNELLDLTGDILRISYNTSNVVAESGLFSFFEKDIENHKRLDGHNYREGQHSYGGSIQRAPMMLDLREFLLNQDFSEKK